MVIATLLKLLQCVRKQRKSNQDIAITAQLLPWRCLHGLLEVGNPILLDLDWKPASLLCA